MTLFCQDLFSIVIKYSDVNCIYNLSNICKSFRVFIDANFLSLYKIYLQVVKNIDDFKHRRYRKIYKFSRKYMHNYFCVKITNKCIITSIFNFNDDPKIYQCNFVTKNIYNFLVNSNNSLDNDIFIVLKKRKKYSSYKIRSESEPYYKGMIFGTVRDTLNYHLLTSESDINSIIDSVDTNIYGKNPFFDLFVSSLNTYIYNNVL